MIKSYLSLLIILLFCACTRPPKPNSSSYSVEKVHPEKLASRDSDVIVQNDTAVIDRERYTALDIWDKEGSVLYIKNTSGKVVFYTKSVLDFEFKDVDGDSYKDLLIERRGVDSGQQDLVLYDPKTKKFILVGNCSNANKIKHTKYFYSYEDCCMGRYWSSDLFFITDFKIITVGHIKYDDGDGLKFYSVNGEKKILRKRWAVRINGDTPVTTGRHIDFDLGHYWTKNYTDYVK